MNRHTTFVHLTDLHIGNPAVEDDHLWSDTAATLRTILGEVKAITPTPDFILVSGDLTNRGDVGSYDQLKAILDEAGIEVPMFFALGNHDSRPGFYEGMLARSDNLDAPYFHDALVGGIHLIVLDSSAPNKVGGTIEPEQFAWLQERLDAHPDLSKLIMVHHAPALDEDNTSMEWESISCADTADLREMLAGYDVLGIISGHIHHDRVSMWDGIPVVVGIGQHTAMDPLYLHEGLRMVSGASFAIGTIRPSGLTISFVPQPSERRELNRVTYEQMSEVLRRYENAALAAE